MRLVLASSGGDGGADWGGDGDEGRRAQRERGGGRAARRQRRPRCTGEDAQRQQGGERITTGGDGIKRGGQRWHLLSNFSNFRKVLVINSYR